MKKIGRYLKNGTIVLMVALVSVSCSSKIHVSKRVHRKGYYVNYTKPNERSIEALSGPIAIKKSRLKKAELKQSKHIVSSEKTNLILIQKKPILLLLSSENIIPVSNSFHRKKSGETTSISSSLNNTVKSTSYRKKPTNFISGILKVIAIVAVAIMVLMILFTAMYAMNG
tara:strand:- start:1866 stop:2375 length:510 start_codon:yes stop_codon:yes gene_type:complete